MSAFTPPKWLSVRRATAKELSENVAGSGNYIESLPSWDRLEYFYRSDNHAIIVVENPSSGSVLGYALWELNATFEVMDGSEAPIEVPDESPVLPHRPEDTAANGQTDIEIITISDDDTIPGDDITVDNDDTTASNNNTAPDNDTAANDNTITDDDITVDNDSIADDDTAANGETAADDDIAPNNRTASDNEASSDDNTIPDDDSLHSWSPTSSGDTHTTANGNTVANNDTAAEEDTTAEENGSSDEDNAPDDNTLPDYIPVSPGYTLPDYSPASPIDTLLDYSPASPVDTPASPVDTVADDDTPASPVDTVADNDSTANNNTAAEEDTASDQNGSPHEDDTSEGTLPEYDPASPNNAVADDNIVPDNDTIAGHDTAVITMTTIHAIDLQAWSVDVNQDPFEHDIGAMLVKWAIKEAREKGWWVVMPAYPNGAEFFKKLGFQTVRMGRVMEIRDGKEEPVRYFALPPETEETEGCEKVVESLGGGLDAGVLKG